MSVEPRRRRRPLRLLAGIALVLLVGVVLIVALLPTLASMGPGRRIVASAIGDAVGAPATVDRLSLSWFGTQSIGGLRLTDAAGAPTADLDASIDRSLIALLRGRWMDAEVTLDGMLKLERTSDGTIQVVGAQPQPTTATTRPTTPTPTPTPTPAPAPQTEPFRLPTPLDLKVTVSNLDLSYTCSQTGVDLHLPDLAAGAAVRTSGPINITFRSAVHSEGRVGSLNGHVAVDRAVGTDGVVDLAHAKVNVDLRVERVAFASGGDRLDIDSFHIQAATDDLANGLAGTISSALRSQGATPMALATDLTLDVDMPDGDWLRTEMTVGGTIDATMYAPPETPAEAAPDSAVASGASSPTPAMSPATTPATTPTPRPASTPATPAAPSALPSLFPPGLDARVRIADLSLTLTDEATDRSVAARGLVGNANVASGKPIQIGLGGATVFMEPDESGTRRIAAEGTFNLALLANGLIDDMGTLRFERTSVDMDASIASVVLPLPGRLVEIRELTAKITSPNLVASAEVTIQGSGSIDGETESTIAATVSAERPLSANGELTLRPDRVRGEMTAVNLPLALLEPFLADAPIEVVRDIGERADAQFTLPGGDAPASLSITAQRLTANATGRTNIADAIELETLRVRWRPSLAFVAEMLGESGYSVAEEFEVAFDANDLRVPLVPSEDGDAVDLAAASGRFESGIASTIRAIDATGAATTIGPVALSMTTTSLGDGADLTIAAQLMGGTIAGEQRLTELFDADGELDPTAMVATGELRIRDLPRDRVLAFVPDASRALVASILDRSPAVTITTGGSAATRTASVHAELGKATITTDLALDDDTLAISETTATLVADDAIVTALLEGTDAETRPRFVSGTPIVAVVPAVSIPRAMLTDTDRLLREGPPLELRITSERLTMRTATSPETVGVHGLDVTGRLTPGTQPGLDLTGGLKLQSGNANAGTLTFTGRSAMTDDGLAPPTGRIEARGLQVAALERLAGLEPETMSAWLGASGDLVAEATSIDDAIELVVRPAFTTLTGELAATVGAETIRVPDANLALALDQAQVARLMAPPAAAAASPDDAPPLKALTGWNAALRITDVVIDRALFGDGDPGAAARSRGTVRIDAQPLALGLGAERIEVNDLQIVLATDRLSDGLRLNAIAGRPNGARAAAGNVTQAVLAITATLKSLTDAQGRFDTERAIIDSDVAAESIPTALVDRMTAMNGLLVAALGPTMTASLRTQGLSRTAGTLAGKLTSANGFLDIPRVTSRDGSLRVESSMPIRAELALTPPLRRELLHGINPVLADLRTVDQPIRAVVSSAILPLDGNMRGFNAAVLMTIGRMEIDSGSAIVTLLDLTGIQRGRELAGLIEPFNLKVVDGNMTYDDLALKLGLADGAYRYAILFKGDVDLGSDPPMARAITTRLPADILSKSIRDLPTGVGRLHADVVFSGPLYSPDGEPRQLKRDIKFGGDVGGIIEDVIGDLFRRRR